MTRVDWRYSRLLVGIFVVGNLLPLFGVWVLDWQVVEVLTLYWIEWGGVVVAGLVMACPADLVTLPLPGRREARLKTRRGRVSLVGVDCHPRNVVVVAVLLLVALVWALVGIASVVYPAVPVSPAAVGAQPLLVGGVLLTTHGLAVREYLRTERYRHIPPEAAVRPAVAFAVGASTLAALSVVVNEPPLGQRPALLALVTAKACVEVWFRCRARDVFDQLDGHIDPFEFEPSRSEILSLGRYAVDLPAVPGASDPVKTAHPARLTLLLAAPGVGAVFSPRLTQFGLATALFGTVLVVLGAPISGLLAVGAGLAFVLVPGLFVSVLRDFPLEYQFYDDRLVCHDRWLDTAQWSLAYDQIERVDTTRSPTQRLTGSGTLVLETDDGSPAHIRSIDAYREVSETLDAVAHSGDAPGTLPDGYREVPA